MNEKFKNYNGWCNTCGCQDYEIDEFESPVLYDENGSPIEDGPKYMRMEAYCPKCDTTIYVDEIHKENIARKREAEREYYGLCSHEDLLKLPKKYGVPREMIDEILNLESNLWLREPNMCGVSLWDGETPSTSESERIQKALESPQYFMECMDNVKDKLPKEFYERVRPRIEKMK